MKAKTKGEGGGALQKKDGISFYTYTNQAGLQGNFIGSHGRIVLVLSHPS